MFTISPYAFYPLFQRFVTLWRYVQVVSDCLTFLLSMLCCQCWALMPMSPTASEKASVEDFQILPQAVIDPGRASGEPFQAQHLVIDFTPQPEDTEEMSTKCQKFWDEVHSHPDLESMMVQLETKPQASKQSTVPVHKHSSSPLRVEHNYPVIHTIRSKGDRGEIATALAASTSRRKQ